MCIPVPPWQCSDLQGSTIRDCQRIIYRQNQPLPYSSFSGHGYDQKNSAGIECRGLLFEFRWHKKWCMFSKKSNEISVAFFGFLKKQILRRSFILHLVLSFPGNVTSAISSRQHVDCHWFSQSSIVGAKSSPGVGWLLAPESGFVSGKCPLSWIRTGNKRILMNDYYCIYTPVFFENPST